MKSRSDNSLLALLNRRNKPEDHQAISLVRPLCEEKVRLCVVAVECSCSHKHPLKKSFEVAWETTIDIIPTARKEEVVNCGNVNGLEAIIDPCSKSYTWVIEWGKPQ